MFQDLIKENQLLECKLASKGLPESLWPTYCAFANTEGGTILLGVKEENGSFSIAGLTEEQIEKYRKDLWNTVNNHNKVSCNVLLPHHVTVLEEAGKKLLRIAVPPADRREKPVYIGPDPMKGTYRRSHEGDYLCSRDEVRNMFADGQEIPMDSKAVEHMGLDSLNPDSVKQYRMQFSRLHDRHPWNRLQDDEFLLRLKAASRNRSGGVSPTYAGLLMFGEAYRITEEFPDYFLDYREESERSEARWLFRINSDEGDWSGNLHDFYFRIINRLDDNIAVPFVNRRDGFRVSVTKVHEALWEAVANALVHAEYKGRRGICIVREDNKITISNPGTLRITREEFFAGGNSDPRNPALLKMFNFLNIGERAGSGVEKIFSAWREQAWPDPEYVFEYSPERVTLTLETGQIVYIPGSADLRDIPQSVGKERILLDYVKEHGSVTTSLVMEICGYKSRSAAQKLIEKLIDRKALERTGTGRQTEYVLSSDCPPTVL